MFVMSPELIHKIESTPTLAGPVNSSSSLVAVLEKALDSNREIILADEKRLQTPKETVVVLEPPTTDVAMQTEEIPNEEKNCNG